MKTKLSNVKSLLSFVLVFAMMATMILPSHVLAANPSTITTDLDSKEIIIGSPVEFTVSTVKNDDDGIWVKGKFEITADIADIAKLEYMETAPGMEGWYDLPTTVSGDTITGEFGPAGTGFPISDATSTFRVTFAKKGTYAVKVSALKVDDDSEVCSYSIPALAVYDYADYSQLESAIILGQAYESNKSDYTVNSYAALESAIANAKAVESDLPETKQSDIDALTKAIEDAIAGLTQLKKVDFVAVAVADDVNDDYAKATKIVLVFAEPVADGADILSNLSVKDSISNAKWIDSANTIYELTIDTNSALANDTVITYTSNDAVKTKLGAVLDNTSATVAGNLEEAYSQVTASNMAATIVKANAKHGVNAGDKIVIVFNAPVYDAPDKITVNDMEAVAVSSSNNTIYEIVLDGTENISDSTKLTYGSITDVSLDGTFGIAVAPKALKAVAVNNDGTAKVAGDEIVVVFDRITNHAAIDLAKDGIISGTANATFGTTSSYRWDDENTKLVITLGDDAVVANGAKINLSNQGIKDRDNIIDASISEMTIEGTFGTVKAPKTLKAYAIDTNGEADFVDDQIVVVFDRPTNAPTSSDLLAGVLSGIPGANLANSTFNWEDAGSKLVITIGDSAVVATGTRIDLSNKGIMDADGIVDAEISVLTIEGSFGMSIEPKITRAIAFTQNNKHKIRVFFNTEVEYIQGTSEDVYIIGGNDLIGNWVHNGISYFDVTLPDDHSELPADARIKFEGTFVDSLTKKIQLVAPSVSLEGGFEKDVEMEVLSLTAYSKTGCGIAKAGDTIVLVLNSEATSVESSLGNFESTDNVTWTYKLERDNQVDIGKQVTFTIKSKVNGKVYSNKTAEIAGSFGYKVVPELLSATAYSNDGSGVAKKGDEIILVFNAPVTGVTSSLGDVAAEDEYVWKITLNKDNAVNIGETLGFKVKSVITGEYIDVSKELGGSFGKVIEPKIVAATVYSKDGSGIAKAGDEIVFVFNTSVKNFETSLGTATTSDNYVWTVVLGNNPDVKLNETYIAKAASVATGTIYNNLQFKLEGNFGKVIEPEILNITAVSTDGSGVAKVGDKIVVVFNTKVKFNDNGVEKEDFVYTYTLKSSDVMDNFKIGKDFSITVTSASTGKSYTLSKAIGGSYGKEIVPNLLSVTAYSRSGSGSAKTNDEIVVVFDAEVSDLKIVGNYSLATPVQDDDKGYVWRIKITKDDAVQIGDMLSFTAKSVSTGAVVAFNNAELVGSFGKPVEPELISATAYSKDGSGVAKAGDEIVLVFNAQVSSVSVEGNIGTVVQEDGYIWKIILGNNPTVTTNSKLNVNAISLLSGKAVKYENVKLEGSFGKEIDPEILSVTAVSNRGAGVPEIGDEIIVVFNTKVKIGNSFDGYVYTYKLSDTDNLADFEIGDIFKVDIQSSLTGKMSTLEGEIKGTYGVYKETKVVSAILSESDGTEYITVTFNNSTNVPDIAVDTNSVLYKNNSAAHISNVSWKADGTVLEFTLGDGSQITKDYKLNLSGLDIKSADMFDIKGLDSIDVTGALIPVVNKVQFIDKTIEINFSTRTNGYINISPLNTLLGVGAKAIWSDNNKKLVITLGDKYTITNNGYITLTGLGVKDGFSGEYSVVGQYRVEGTIATDTLAVTSIVAQSNDKSSAVAKNGDKIIIKFNAATNLNGADSLGEITQSQLDAIVKVGNDNEAALGTGYTAHWTAYDTLEITLGGKTTSNDASGNPFDIGKGPDVKVGTKINVSNVALADGQGTMAPASIALAGSFNGREFAISNAKISRTIDARNGDYRVTANVENTLLNTSLRPTIVCVAYNGEVPVSVMRITIDIENSASPIFDFPQGLNVTRAKLYVFNDAFATINNIYAPSVLAEEVEVTLAN